MVGAIHACDRRVASLPQLPALPSVSTGLAWVVWVSKIARIVFAAVESGATEALREVIAGPALVKPRPAADRPAEPERQEAA